MLENIYVDVATYWATAGDGYSGERLFATPVLINVRWNDKSSLETYQHGNAVARGIDLKLGKCIVHVQQATPVGGYLALGDYRNDANKTTPNAIAAANVIIGYKEVKSVGGTEIVRRAML